MALVRTPSIPAAAVLIACLLVVAACGTGTTTSPSPAPTSSLVAPLGGQTETDWGVIWDTIPTDFPVYPGATPADETAVGPASATFVVDGDVAKDVATWIAPELIPVDTDGSTEIEGPLEDGSYVVRFDGEGDCRVHVTAAPLGSLTSITIMYGAGCPNP
jgi:hypothetical protein